MPTSPRGPVTFRDLTAGLIWPLVWRAVPAAMRPGRVGLGAVFVIAVMALGSLCDWIVGGDPGPFTRLVGGAASGLDNIARGLATLDLWQIGAGLDNLARVGATAHDHPVSAVVLSILILLVAAVIGGALARMAACDIALDQRLSAMDALKFAAARWRSLVAAPVIPLVVLTVIALVLLALGWALFSIPAIGVVGAIIYGLFLLGGLGLTILALAFLLGAPLLTPAVAVESTDAGDAVQRAYSYVLGRTGRLLLYTALLVVCGAVAWTIASWITDSTLGVASRLAFAWTGEGAPYAPPSRSLFGPPGGEGLEGARSVAADIIGVWEKAALALLAGFAVSYFFTASTILYLMVRRVNDEQDIEDIWTGDGARGA